MYIQSFILATLTLSTLAPQAVAQLPPTAPQAVSSQMNSSKVARDTQAAIAQLLQQLPNSVESRPLRTELNALYGQLATITNDTEARDLIDRSLRSLSERLKTEPNYEQVSKVLTGILAGNGNS